MTMQQTTLSIPECGPATLTLTLPERPTPDSLDRLEAAVQHLLHTLRRNLSANTAEDPGSVEFDSWLVDLH